MRREFVLQPVFFPRPNLEARRRAELSRRLRTSVLWIAVFTILSSAQIYPQAAPDFEKFVAPILEKHCLGCHNESDRKGGLDLSRMDHAQAGGDSGPVIVAGRPDDSLLWQYVSSGEMPPEKPLRDDDRQIVQAWIAHGANWSGGPLDPLKYTTDARAGYDWWSLQPLRETQIPADPRSTCATPIDRFVLQRLSAMRLASSPVAERRVLIRRLYFDLLGLPPLPEEITEFERDNSPLAYEKLVDRLLASPHYGQRWARHWLDIVRFGESQGFERDKLRPHAWRYRDWIIDSLNEDMPYDEFARQQLAGDVLPTGKPAGLIATGFLVAGPYDEVGQSQQSEAMRAVVREDELEDLISVVGQTFLGLTVNCSRCHDHKFDPVSQREYYALSACLAGVRHGERPLPAEYVAQQAEAAARDLSARREILRNRVSRIEAPVRDQILAERKIQREASIPPVPAAVWEFDGDLRDGLARAHGESRDGARLSEDGLVLDGNGYVSTTPLGSDLGPKTIEAWLMLGSLEQQGGGVISVQSLDGGTFDAIVFGEKEPRRWMAGSNGFERTRSFQGEQEDEAQKNIVHVAIAYHADGTIVGYRNGVRYGEPYRVKQQAAFRAGQYQVLFGLRHSPPGGNRFLRGEIVRACLYDRALGDEEIAASAGVMLPVSERELIAGLSEWDRAERSRLRSELQHLQEQLDRVRANQVYTATPKPPHPTHVLIRGNPAQKGEHVFPAGIQALRGVAPAWGLTPESSDAERRIQLAKWITDRQNPLFARVIVNRLWLYHFGAGFVDTPNDFGFNGGKPTHHELLDWLASDLIDHDWSLKHLHRRMVTSSTYRQSSAIPRAGTETDRANKDMTIADPLATDSDNRLLWRMTPRRLEAEVLRDAILFLAGELDGTTHGPGYYDFTTFTSNSQFYEMRDPAGGSFQRRTIYRTWVRSGRSPFLDVFDCPDPSTKTPRRAATTTPLQALSLLNNSFVLRMADRFAERVARESGGDIAQQVERVFRYAYGRSPDEHELADCERAVHEHGLATLCRVVFNTNEFLYVD